MMAPVRTGAITTVRNAKLRSSSLEVEGGCGADIELPWLWHLNALGVALYDCQPWQISPNDCYSSGVQRTVMGAFILILIAPQSVDLYQLLRTILEPYSE